MGTYINISLKYEAWKDVVISKIIFKCNSMVEKCNEHFTVMMEYCHRDALFCTKFSVYKMVK